MIVVTTNALEGYTVTAYKGVVRGLIVRSPTIGQGIVGGLKNIIGGKIGAYTTMCEQARQHAYDAMRAEAEKLGANAILAMRFDSGDLGGNSASAEVLCYGTAVVVEPCQS